MSSRQPLSPRSSPALGRGPAGWRRWGGVGEGVHFSPWSQLLFPLLPPSPGCPSLCLSLPRMHSGGLRGSSQSEDPLPLTHPHCCLFLLFRAPPQSPEGHLQSPGTVIPVLLSGHGYPGTLRSCSCWFSLRCCVSQSSQKVQALLAAPTCLPVSALRISAKPPHFYLLLLSPVLRLLAPPLSQVPQRLAPAVQSLCFCQ